MLLPLGTHHEEAVSVEIDHDLTLPIQGEVIEEEDDYASTACLRGFSVALYPHLKLISGNTKEGAVSFQQCIRLLPFPEDRVYLQ